MHRAVVYLRVSRADQLPENQVTDLRRMAEQRGLHVVDVVEERMSGAKKARPGLQRVLDGAHRGRFDVLLVWALDRLGRTMSGVVDVVQQLDRCGVQVISHQEPWLAMEGPVRPLLLAIFGWVAEQERQRLIERTRAGLETAKSRGSKLGRPAVELDVDRALRLRKAGKSIREVAAELGVGVGTVHRALGDHGNGSKSVNLQ